MILANVEKREHEKNYQQSVSGSTSEEKMHEVNPGAMHEECKF